MISTVTTATVTTVTSATSTVGGVVGALGLVAVLTFLALLIEKEIVSAGASARSRMFARCLNIGIVPLGFAFLMIAGAQLLQVLG